MKKCKKCGFSCLSLEDKCSKCGAGLDGVKNVTTANCVKCGHYRSMPVTFDKQEQFLCFGCYNEATKHRYFQSKELAQWGSSDMPQSLKFERLALCKIVEAKYYRDEEMLALADKLYVGVNDMRNNINEENCAKLPLIVQELLNY